MAAFSQDGQKVGIQDVLMPQGGEIPLFAARTPFARLLDKGEAEAKGLWLQMPFARTASSEAIQLTGNGADTLPVGVGGTMDYMRVGWIYTCFEPTVFTKEEDESVASGVENLKAIRLKVDSGILQQDLEFWRLTGAIRSSTNGVLKTLASVAGLQTMNGNVTWANAANTGITDRGFVQQLVPASQTGNVQSLAVGSDYVNQYAAGASWSAGTTPAALENLIVTMQNLGQIDESRGVNMEVDSAIADSISFTRLLNYLHDSVRVESTQVDQFGGTSYFLPYMGVKFYSSPHLDPTNAAFAGTDAISTGATDGGLIYVFASKALQSRLSVPSYKDWTEVVGVGQSKYVARVNMKHQLVCNRLPLIGGISKTRIA